MAKLTIGKNEYEITEKNLPQTKLLFYPDNPRVYSQFDLSNGEKPTQAEIEKLMTSMEHVKQLKLSIESNGGLIDPLIVRDGDFIVLEGNSRLAAYRLLARTNPLKWGYVKCKLLPSDIPDSAIFTLLGQYHIIGRKDWSPYEQAGYLYRRHKETKLPISKMAEELGITTSSAKRFIDVYSFMILHNDANPSKWSYYEEYLKNKSISKARNKHASLDEKVVEMIKTNKIAQASDIRKLGDIAKLNDENSEKTIEKISDGYITIDQGYEELESEGKFDDAAEILEKLRNQINDQDFKNKVLNNKDREQSLYIIKQVIKNLESIKKELEND